MRQLVPHHVLEARRQRAQVAELRTFAKRQRRMTASEKFAPAALAHTEAQYAKGPGPYPTAPTKLKAGGSAFDRALARHKVRQERKLKRLGGGGARTYNRDDHGRFA